MTAPVDVDARSFQLTPRFWQSPFVLAAATTLTIQFALYGLAILDGRPLPVDLVAPLLATTALVLTAGLWPSWNYVRIGETDLEQHAGLTHVRIPFDDIKSVRTGLHGVDIFYVQREAKGKRALSHARVFNRYGVPAAHLHHMIDDAWQRAAQRSFSGA